MQQPTRPVLTPAAARVIRAMRAIHAGEPIGSWQSAGDSWRWPTLAAIALAADLSEGSTSAALRELDALRLVTVPRNGALRSEGVSLTTLADSRRLQAIVAQTLAGEPD